MFARNLRARIDNGLYVKDLRNVHACIVHHNERKKKTEKTERRITMKQSQQPQRTRSVNA